MWPSRSVKSKLPLYCIDVFNAAFTVFRVVRDNVVSFIYASKQSKHSSKPSSSILCCSAESRSRRLHSLVRVQ